MYITCFALLAPSDFWECQLWMNIYYFPYCKYVYTESDMCVMACTQGYLLRPRDTHVWINAKVFFYTQLSINISVLPKGVVGGCVFRRS